MLKLKEPKELGTQNWGKSILKRGTYGWERPKMERAADSYSLSRVCIKTKLREKTMKF